MFEFSLLLATLPPDSNALRLRIWRAVKGLGCGALRDGAFLLPAAHTDKLEELAGEISAHGGTTWLVNVTPRSDDQATTLAGLFDRRESYREWAVEVDRLRKVLARGEETVVRKRFRALQEGLAALQRIDYFPGSAAGQASESLSALQRDVDRQFSSGEPTAHPGDIQQLAPAKYVGKTWATRARPWVDRLACGWFIRRFIDRDARFVWLEQDARKAPKGVVGFDYDGAAFSHVGALVSFEVMVSSFGFHGDAALRQLAATVHFLDAGGIPTAEAAVLENILGGLRDMHADDDGLLTAACVVFDGLYVAARKEAP